MSTILLTGALGVIGQHASTMLRDAGHTVIGADLAIRDYSDYVRTDVTSFEDLHRIGKNHKIDLVIHMAGEVGRLVGEHHPQRMVTVNDVGTVNVIQFCLEADARLIYFSTSEVYGHLLDADLPVTEEQLDHGASAFVTTNIYAMSKLFGEALVKHYVDNYGLAAVGVRPFMVYGPGEAPSRWRSAMTNFVHAARHGQDLTVHRDAVRAWCHVADFIAGIQILADQPPRATYEAYNLGADDYRTMEQVAHVIVDSVGAPGASVTVVDPPSQFMSLKKRANIDKIRQLGYSPRISLEDGVKSVAAWQVANGF